MRKKPLLFSHAFATIRKVFIGFLHGSDFACGRALALKKRKGKSTCQPKDYGNTYSSPRGPWSHPKNACWISWQLLCTCPQESFTQKWHLSDFIFLIFFLPKTKETWICPLRLCRFFSVRQEGISGKALHWVSQCFPNREVYLGRGWKMNTMCMRRRRKWADAFFVLCCSQKPLPCRLPFGIDGLAYAASSFGGLSRAHALHTMPNAAQESLALVGRCGWTGAIPSPSAKTAFPAPAAFPA